MDLTLTESEQAFRDEFRAWIEENHPGPAPRGGDQAQYEFEREWQRKLHSGGWAGVSWPKEYGGRGATLIEQSIFGEELARARAPRPANVLGLVMGGPVVIAHGTEEQKERYLEPILSAEEIWCQGFSEPESGSDLASLKTKAVKDNGGWRITGQKVWTTFAHEAKWCMLVARTDQDVPKHKGLTYFLMDMEQDEVDIRPLRQITGEAEFNELFIENAYVPDENVVGGVGNGWMVAITTLMNERAGLGASAALGLSNALDELIELAKERGRADDPIVRDKVARLKIGIEGLRLGAMRALTQTMKVGIPGPEGSIAKLQWSSTNQALTELALEIGGMEHARQGVALGVPVPALAGELDRGRHDRRPQEHRRRARPRPSEAALRPTGPWTSTSTTSSARSSRPRASSSPAASSPRRSASSPSPRRPTTTTLWKQICDLGWPGIAIAEEYGGQGLGIVELVILQEELGYALAPSPMISNAYAGVVIESARLRRAEEPLAAGDRLGRGARRRRARPATRHPIVGAAAGASVLVLARRRRRASSSSRPTPSSRSST